MTALLYNFAIFLQDLSLDLHITSTYTLYQEAGMDVRMTNVMCQGLN